MQPDELRARLQAEERASSRADADARHTAQREAQEAATELERLGPLTAAALLEVGGCGAQLVTIETRSELPPKRWWQRDDGVRFSYHEEEASGWEFHVYKSIEHMKDGPFEHSMVVFLLADGRFASTWGIYLTGKQKPTLSIDRCVGDAQFAIDRLRLIVETHGARWPGPREPA